MRDPFSTFRISCDWTCHITRNPPSSGGTDYAIPVGTPIRASFGGILTNRPPVQYPNSGNTAILTRADGLAFYHLHLSRFVAPGPVAEGDIIGYSGGAYGAPGSGSSTGPHVHVNAYVGNTPRDIHDFFITTITAGNSYTPITAVETDSDMPKNFNSGGTIFTLGENFGTIWGSTTSFSYGANMAAYGAPVAVSMTPDQVTTIVGEANARGAARGAVISASVPIDYAALAKAVNDDAARRLAS